jgi:long-chain fatty acid transport protein
MKKFALRPLVAALVLTAPVMSAFATDGYFSHGYGMKAKGMGGAAVASTDNAFAGANNPATSAWAGNRFEAGVDWFSPKRSASRTGSQGGFADGNLESGSNNFFIPEFGYNKRHSDTVGYGVTVYGNGGMNTDYNPGDPMFDQGQSRMGVDLVQLIVAPTLAMKLDDKHSVGVSPLFIVQQFSVQGVQNFKAGPPNGPDSVNLSAMTNRGYDQSTGLGLRLGYLGKLTPQLNVGASYSPKTKMSKLGDYEGFFADAGGFDIPENYVVGLSYQANSQWLVAMDYQRINYGDVPSIANPGANQMTANFGSPQGAGFGWKSINVIKLGTEWKYSSNLTLRAGVNLSDNPISSSEVTFNRMAPGVMTTHYTLGGTYTLTPTTEVSMAYMRAPESSVTGQGTTPVRGTETIRMSQQSLGIQFGWKF